MTQDIEKYAQAIMDVGAEVDSHIDGDARIQTFTFNEAQVVAFAELVAEEARRERDNEWRKHLNAILGTELYDLHKKHFAHIHLSDK